MKITLTKYQAADRLMVSNAYWSYNGAHALVNYLMAMERQTGQEMEFDLTVIRCDWHEYGSVFEACDNKGVAVEPEDGEDEEEYGKRCLKELGDSYTVIEFTGGVVVGDY